MNNDLISREALKKAIQKCEEEPNYQHEGETWQNGLYMAETLIDNATTVTERPQGEWIEGENGNIKCNQCGCEIRYSYLIGNKPEFPKFCCDCGATMIGDKE